MSNETNFSWEQKKVQEVKGSYYIYLPKDWAKKYDIESKKRVMVKRIEDDSLIIKPEAGIDEAGGKFTISLDLDEMPEKLDGQKINQNTYEEYLFNQYLTAYIIGYKTIIFKKRTSIPLQMRSKIRKATVSNLHGMMIISEKDNMITVEDTTSVVDLKMMMRQMLSKVGISLSSFLEIYEKDLKSEIQELLDQDDQIDAYRYAIERHVHRILRYPVLGITSQTSAVECLHYSEAAKIVERIGDYILNLAVMYQNEPLHDKEFVGKYIKRLYEYFTIIQDYYERENSLKYFQLIENTQKFAEETLSIFYSLNPDKNFFNPLRRIYRLFADIAEIRINDIMCRKFKMEGSPAFK